jgi:hypothetical protein
MSISRRQFITLGTLFATTIVVQPVFACPDVDTIVEAAKILVGSTKYKNDVAADSVRLCFDIYRHAKVRFRYRMKSIHDIQMIVRHTTTKITSLEHHKGSMLIWRETSSAIPYVALYLGDGKVITSWYYQDGFISRPKVAITSLKKATNWPHFLGYIPIYTIAEGD